MPYICFNHTFLLGSICNKEKNRMTLSDNSVKAATKAPVKDRQFKNNNEFHEVCLC